MPRNLLATTAMMLALAVPAAVAAQQNTTAAAQQTQQQTQAASQQVLQSLEGAEQTLEQALSKLEQGGEQAMQEASEALANARSTLDSLDSPDNDQTFGKARDELKNAEQAIVDKDAEKAVSSVEQAHKSVGELRQRVQQSASGQGGDALRLVVKSPAPEVEVDRQQAKVQVDQSQPRVQVKQPDPQVTVTQPKPQVDVDVTVPKAQVEVKQPDPQVQVTQRQPQVDVKQPAPQVSVQQPEPQVEIERGKPQINVTQADPQVTVQQADPKVQVEQGKPQVEVKQADQQADVNVDVKRAETDTSQPMQQQAQTGSSAQDATKTLAREAQPSAEPRMSMAQLEDMVGKNVVGADGKEIGEVHDVLIGPDGEAMSVIVERGGFLGLGESLYEIRWDQIELRGDALTTSMTEDEVKQAPKFDYSGSETRIRKD
ncbi:PRC-barrel domain-containing protein [Marinimicrococcus flavescens]|uniref:PRC-barrel domain-containing protein n=1 Tax=Marinimicrococcus flavescens TaxID=3031815 RepID=A0AAP3XRJ7_9PROT|nr:PRC-barrel domain-containing protein [Marinimicrococcus flavescens]